MAAPQTHFVLTWVLYRIFTWVIGIHFSAIETLLVFFLGVGVDIDHFVSKEFVRDVFKVRIVRFLKGGAVGKPTAGVKIPLPWFHCILMLFVVVAWSGYFWLKTGFVLAACIPLGFWLLHVVVIDIFQSSEGEIAYYSVLWPIVKEKKLRKWGYPIKSRAEVLVSSFLFGAILFYEAPLIALGLCIVSVVVLYVLKRRSKHALTG